MAIRKREIEITKLFLGSTPFVRKGDITKLSADGELTCRLLHRYFATVYKEMWPHDTDGAPAYAYARHLGMHRIVWNEWRLGMFQLGLWDLRPSVKTHTLMYEPGHPSFRPDNYVSMPMFLPKAVSEDEAPMRFEVTVQEYDPYDPDTREELDRNMVSVSKGKQAVRYFQKYYLSTVDEYRAIFGKPRRFKDGYYFAPIQVMTDGIDLKDLLYETEDRKREVAAACRVADIKEVDSRVRPLFVPAHRGKTPLLLRNKLNPPKPLPIKKKPK